LRCAVEGIASWWFRPNSSATILGILRPGTGLKSPEGNACAILIFTQETDGEVALATNLKVKIHD